MRLSHRDFAALQEAILQIYEFRDLDSFRTAVPGILLKLISGNCMVWPEYGANKKTGQPTLQDCVASDAGLRASMIKCAANQLADHPFTRFFSTHGPCTALKISDFVSLPNFRSSRLYDEAYRHFGIDRELCAVVRSGRGYGLAALAVGRRGRDFSERDRTVLNLLRPHFDRAHRNARLTSEWLGRAGKFHSPDPLTQLTPRETEVASWLTKGKTNAEIAIILHARPRTVEKHVEKILEKLGVENRTTAAVTLAGKKL